MHPKKQRLISKRTNNRENQPKAQNTKFDSYVKYVILYKIR